MFALHHILIKRIQYLTQLNVITVLNYNNLNPVRADKFLYSGLIRGINFFINCHTSFKMLFQRNIQTSTYLCFLDTLSHV